MDNSSPDPDSVRIGTAEREAAARALGEHFAAGRLHTDEYEFRLTAAYEAPTLRYLRGLFDDLPEPRPAFLAPPMPPMPMPTGQAMPLMPGQYSGYAAYPGFAPGPSDKSKLTAGLLQILLPFGTGRFYTGHIGLGLGQLAVVLFTCGAGVLWPIIDGIVLLANGGTDQYGRKLLD
jgi:TM2 domain-containing membrane protein YozV